VVTTSLLFDFDSTAVRLLIEVTKLQRRNVLIAGDPLAAVTLTYLSI